MMKTPSLKEIEEFIINLPCFRGEASVRGKTEGQLLTLDTPCQDCFHFDIDGVDMCIIGPIVDKFEIEDFRDILLFPKHFSPKRGDPFYSIYRKYPKKVFGSKKMTLRRFAEMVYDIIRIKNGLSIS